MWGNFGQKLRKTAKRSFIVLNTNKKSSDLWKGYNRHTTLLYSHTVLKDFSDMHEFY